MCDQAFDNNRDTTKRARLSYNLQFLPEDREIMTAMQQPLQNQAMAFTTITTALTRPISSPAVHTSSSNNRTLRPRETKEDIFTYSSPYPIPHCINLPTQLSPEDLEFLNSLSYGTLDSVLVDDTLLSGLIVELGLDQPSEMDLPQLEVEHMDLSDSRVLVVEEKS